MIDYRTTIGGAFSALGTTLIGVGVLPQLSGVPNKYLTYCAVAGFICSAVSKFLVALFSADSKTVDNLTTQVNQNSAALISGDTTHVKKGT